MRTVRQIRRDWEERLIGSLCRGLSRSSRFRRTALRHLFQGHMAPSSLAFVTFPDHSLFVDPRDHMIAYQLVSGRAWQRAEFERAMQITRAAGALKPGGWFVDVGANIGTQSIYALLSGQFRGVVAIEPDPHNASLLRRNLAHNGFSAQVRIIELAASNRSGVAKFYRDAENFGAHALEPLKPQRIDSWVEVKTQPLDDILAELGIAPADVGLVLIDVEGHEIEVLRGMQSVRRQRVPIVAEVSGSVHGAAGLSTLRSLLSADYDHIAHLRPDDSQAGNGQHLLDGFDFGTRQTDVLIYSAAVAKPAG